jgi:hypothetical protein
MCQQEFQISVLDEKGLYWFFGFFIQPQNWKPLQDVPNSEREEKPAPKEILLLRNYPD